MSTINQLFDFFLPRFCNSCRNKLSTKELFLCEYCISTIKRADSELLNHEFNRKFYKDKIISDFTSLYIFQKDQALQNLVHNLKYNGSFRVGIFLGKLIGKELQNTINKWNGITAVNAGYVDNPLIANYGTTNTPRNPLGISTFYGCPSLSSTSANPSVVDGRNEYGRTAVMPFKVLGFSDDPKNIPDTYGQPNQVAVAGTYFNTPFLNVVGIINNHVYRPGSVSVTPA